ncbi:MAG TPA: hypothetical protein VN577_09980 [Terriglobales bacterium]|nr:hypothetical protein [Terriglobales bacterium]
MTLAETIDQLRYEVAMLKAQVAAVQDMIGVLNTKIETGKASGSQPMAGDQKPKGRRLSR